MLKHQPAHFRKTTTLLVNGNGRVGAFRFVIYLAKRPDFFYMNGTLSFLSILLAFVLPGCKTTQMSHHPAPATGMFKVAVLYPNGDGKTFDMDYYEKKHMPMVAGFLGNNLKFYEIDKGISGRTPTDRAPFVAVGYFYVNDIAEYSKAIAAKRDAVVGDFKNYTNIQPVVNISEVRQVIHVSTKNASTKSKM
jgi:uncharacterized protein (TIGR02118 family)